MPKTKRTLIFILILVCVAWALMGCQPSSDDPIDEGSQDNIIANGKAFISVQQGKELFISDFNPLFPNSTILESAKYTSYYELGTAYNYVLELNSSLSKEDKREKRYESYSYSLAYPITLDNLGAYGLCEDDLIGWTNPVVWLDETYALEKLDETELAFGDILSEMMFPSINRHYIPGNLQNLNSVIYVGERISYVQFNAYCKDKNLGFPKAKAYLDNIIIPKKTWNTMVETAGVQAKITIAEEKDAFLATLKNSPDYEEIELVTSKILNGENNTILKSTCIVEFEKTGICYEIIYPLFYRIIDERTEDYGSDVATDSAKMAETAKKSAIYFIGLMQ